MELLNNQNIIIMAIKKAQSGVKVKKPTTTKTTTKTPTTAKKPVKPQKKSNNPADMYKGKKDAWGKPVGGEGTNPPFTPEERAKMPKVGGMGSGKNGKTIKKAKSGTSMNKCKYGCK
jgi:hypothetical protein